MLQTQLEEIKFNIKKKLDQYESGIEKYPYFYYKEGQSPLYDYDTSKLKTIDQNKVTSFIDNFWNSYKYVEIFYKSHEETPATEKECHEGIDYLNQEKVLQTVIEYFIQSYGIDIPQKEYERKKKELDIIDNNIISREYSI